MWHDVSRGIRNFWTFRKVVWHFVVWDYTGLLELIEIATREMRDYHRYHGNTVSAPKIARQLTVISELCRRLREDNYLSQHSEYVYEHWSILSEYRRTQIVRHALYQAKQDAEYLGKFMRFVI